MGTSEGLPPHRSRAIVLDITYVSNTSRSQNRRHDRQLRTRDDPRPDLHFRAQSYRADKRDLYTSSRPRSPGGIRAPTAARGVDVCRDSVLRRRLLSE